MQIAIFSGIYAGAANEIPITVGYLFTMKLLRSIATLLLVLVAASTADDLAWYRSVLTEQVAPSYVAAYRTLKDKIINPLLPASSEVLDTNETNATQIVSLARRLTCATKALYGNLSSALKASEKLNQDLEKKLQELISSVSQKEKEVRQTNDQLSAIAARLADTQGKVNEAENTVRDKENELNQANSHLEDEQRKGKLRIAPTGSLHLTDFSRPSSIVWSPEETIHRIGQ